MSHAAFEMQESPHAFPSRQTLQQLPVGLSPPHAAPRASGGPLNGDVDPLLHVMPQMAEPLQRVLPTSRNSALSLGRFIPPARLFSPTSYARMIVAANTSRNSKGVRSSSSFGG